MRIVILLFMMSTCIFALDSISYFKKSKENKLLCHIGQYSFKLVTHKNAVIENIHGHEFFKLTDENLYFLSNACQPLSKKEGIIF